jgi:chromosome segregation ATPase
VGPKVRPPIRWIAAVVVVVGLVAGVTGARRAWSDTRDATERTEASLRATRSDLARTHDELATATADRREAQTTLGDRVATLATRQDERDDAQHGLDVVTLLLTQVQSQLAASQADLQDRTTRLDAFNRCLVGVAQALNQAAVNDTDGLASTVRGIEGVCAQAGVAL